MRKVTRQIAEAFRNGDKRTIGNTHTDGHSVWLHGNLIAEMHHDGIRLTLAGWNTPTTRERLNGILLEFGFNAGFCQRNFSAVLMQEEIRQEIANDEWLMFLF